jgi:hypothetical protein
LRRGASGDRLNITAAVAWLMNHRTGMGDLFKVMAIGIQNGLPPGLQPT